VPHDIEVENYEHNLKLLHDAKQNENNILLTSSIPTQLTQIKTLLWINFAFIGFMFQVINYFNLSQLFIAFLVFSITAIYLSLFSMLGENKKAYGVNDDIQIMSQYEDNKWTKSQVLYDMISSLQVSLEYNRKILNKRGKLLKIAKYFTLLSSFTIILIFSLQKIINKEIKMSQDKSSKPTISLVQPKPVLIAEDSAGTIKNNKPQPDSKR
jgi:hypothetical protein